MPRTIYSDDHELLVSLLREYRLRRKLTQAELSERMNRPQSFVSKVESGQRRLDVVELRQWCDALGVDLVALVRKWNSGSHFG